METGKRKYEISPEKLAIRTAKIQAGYAVKRENGMFNSSSISIRVTDKLRQYCLDNGIPPYKILDYVAYGTLSLEKLRELVK